MNGMIFDIKEMAVHDGPGIRTTVFFKGCPLRCIWCHNPEGLKKERQLMYKQARCRHCGLCMRKCTHEDCRQFGRCLHICPENCLAVSGEEIGAKELSARLKASARVLSDSFGGITFSGGEPLFQPDFLIELSENLKDYHLCIETSGYAEPEIFKSAVGHLDMVIMDIKLADSEMHRKYTGVGNEKILENFKYLKSCKKPYLIRTPLIPGITDGEENLAAIEKIIGGSNWEQLPYNSFAKAKYDMMGMEYKYK